MTRHGVLEGTTLIGDGSAGLVSGTNMGPEIFLVTESERSETFPGRKKKIGDPTDNTHTYNRDTVFIVLT